MITLPTIGSNARNSQIDFQITNHKNQASTNQPESDAQREELKLSKISC